MCVVVDPPLFISMNKTSHPKHAEFSPIKAWILTGKGKIVFGGSKYRKELLGVSSVLGFIAELDRARKTVRISDALVDRAARFAKKKAPAADFDDEHIVGIVSVSGCMVVCIDDGRAHKYFKKKNLYQSNISPPKLYTGKRNKSLLSSRFCAPCCR